MNSIGGLGPELAPLTGEATPTKEVGGGFSDALAKAVGSVDALQQDADKQSAQLAHGGGNLHEAALSLEKADIGMRLLTKARNKLVEAYQDVMRMSV
jgi:flagellar hook-basal body complex protein FliE